MKTNLLIMLILLLILAIVFTGCFEKKEILPNNNSGDVIIKSGDSEIVPGEYVEVYGNESGIVNYNGDLFFIEYGNNDFAPEAVGSYYSLNIYSNAQRYLNKIDSRGNIKNLFKVTASTNFAIVDDRFYLRSNNGQLYTVNMQGENSVDLTKGYYVGYDYPGHAVFYQNEDTPDVLYRINTETLSIKMYEFDNPTTNNNYNFLTVRNDTLYYSLIDSKNNKLVILEHDVLTNSNREIAEIKLDDVEIMEDEIGNMYICSESSKEYVLICVGVPSTGSMGGYYFADIYTFDLANNSLKKTISFDPTEGGNFYESGLYEAIEKELYKLIYNSKLPDIDSFLSKQDIKDFAEVYNIDLDATLGAEAKNSAAYSEESKKYSIYIEDHHVVGDKVLYKVTACRANPTEDYGWRPATIRIVTEVHIRDLNTGEDQFIYSYVNEKYEEQVKDIMKEIANTSGEPIEVINDKTNGETLKPNEMYLEIKVNNIWKSEFDVRVEEEGGVIFGKRIEYEGHHKKADGTIKLKVNKEVGAMLTVFIDNERHSQVLIDESM